MNENDKKTEENGASRFFSLFVKKPFKSFIGHNN